MTPDRFRQLLDHLGLIQNPQPENTNPHASAPRVLGVDERRVRRWASGNLPIPRAIAVLLEIMAAYRISARDLDRFDFED